MEALRHISECTNVSHQCDFYSKEYKPQRVVGSSPLRLLFEEIVEPGWNDGVRLRYGVDG